MDRHGIDKTIRWFCITGTEEAFVQSGFAGSLDVSNRLLILLQIIPKEGEYFSYSHPPPLGRILLLLVERRLYGNNCFQNILVLKFTKLKSPDQKLNAINERIFYIFFTLLFVPGFVLDQRHKFYYCLVTEKCKQTT